MARISIEQIDFSKGLTITGSFIASGSSTFSGSVVAADGITGSLFGTSSYALQTLSSSYALTASFAPNYTLTSTFVSASASFDARIAANSESIAQLSESFEALSSSFVDLNLTQITSGSYTASIGSYGFQVNTSASISGSLTVTDTIFAQTLVVQVITSSTELITGSLTVSGTLNALGGITGSLYGTSSWASNAISSSYTSTSSYTFTAESASYAATSSHVTPLSQSVIISGSLSVNSTTGSGFVSNADTLIFVGTSSFTGLTSFTSSVVIENQSNPASLFLIKSGSQQYLDIASNSEATLTSNLFIIKNFVTQQPVLTVSQSIVQFATQSSNPSGSAPNGGIWFTSSSLFVGLD
jgi:hypothetical protein